MTNKDQSRRVEVELGALQAEMRTGFHETHRRVDDLLRGFDSMNTRFTRVTGDIGGILARVDLLERRSTSGDDSDSGEKTQREALKFYVWIAAGSILSTISFLYFIGKLPRP